MGTFRVSALALAIAIASSACADDAAPTTVTHTQAVGLAPVNQLPPPQSINEDSPLFFAVSGGNPLIVDDGDNTRLTVQVNVTNGTFTLGDSRDVLVTGDGTSSVTLSGDIAALNAALDQSIYQPSANYNGPATLQINTSDSNGESDLDVLDITVAAFNDPPVNNVPAAVQPATEDVPRAFSLSISDVDIAGAPLLVSLTASNNTLITLPTLAGLTFSDGDGDGDAAMTFSGTLPEVNAALNGVVVTAPLNYIGASTLVITSNDQGATGAGVPGADNDTINLTWTAINDAPVNTVPSLQLLVEDTSLTFSGATALSVADVDAVTALVQVTLTISNGTLSLGNPAGVTFTSGDGTADVAMTFNGTLAALNAALAGTVYTPTPSYAGFATLTMLSNDLGNSGNGGSRTDSDAVVLQITAVNDAPITAVPGAQSTNEDVARTFSTGNGNPITVADPDAPSLQVTLTASNGTLSLAGSAGLTYQAGDGVADPIMTFAGTVASINTALNGASFVPTAHFHGAASLRVAVSDLGATGAGGTLTDDDTIAITVAPVNDPPVAINDALTVAEDAAATDLLVLGNDGIAPDQAETLTITAVGAPLHGVATTDGSKVSYQPTANYHGPDSFTYTISDGNGASASASVAVTVTSVNDAPTAADDSVAVIANSVGNSLAVLSNDSAAPDAGEVLTISAVGAPLHGSVVITGAGTRVSYTSESGYAGADSFTYTISDGNGGLDSATVSVDVTAVISQPVNTLPAPQTIVEDSPLFFSSVAGNAITVTDANNATLTVQVLVTSGTFTMGSTSNLTVSGNGTASVTLSGTLAALNSGLNNARYNPAASYFGPASLTLNSSDSNGESDLDVLTLSITSFNDAPVNAVPTSVEVATEDAPRAFTLSVSDVDLSGAPLLITLTANNGTTISLPTVSGLSFSAGDGLADATMTFAGTLARVNVALNGLTVTAPANYIGTSTLVLGSNDQGGTGAGPVGQDTDTINLSWGAVNDAPVNTVPGPQALTEDGVLVFAGATALRVSDVDATSALVQVTLTATSGTLTLGNPGLVTFTAGDGTADVAMTFSGTLTALDGALASTSYTAAPSFTGAATVTMIANDLGNTGAGGVKQDTDVIAIAVAAVNDAPINGVPAAQLTNEDVARVFSVSNGNPITVADADATSLQVTLSASNGTVTLAGVTGLSLQAGDGTADGLVTFTGTVTALNTALNGLRFTPLANYGGAAGLTVTTNDLGATGAGGALSDDDTIAITVAPVNDPPVAINDTLTVAEDAPATVVAVLGNDNLGPDTGETLTVTAVGVPLHGTATTNGSTVSYQPAASYHGPDSFSYTISDGAGGTATATVAVTITSVNDAPTAADDSFSVLASSVGNSLAVLSNDSVAPDVNETLTISAVGQPLHGSAVVTSGGTRISYTPEAGYSGPDSFSYTLADGNGGLDPATVIIDVVSVITQPVNSLPPPQTIVEDSPLFFSSAAGNAITVSDANNATLTVQVQVSNGTFTLGSTTGLTIVNASNGTANLTCSGSISALNTGLSGARFTPTLDFHGPAMLTINSSDTSGESDLDSLTLAVTSFNDPPINSVPGSLQAAIEDSPRTFGTISVNDVDLSGADLVVTLTASNGTVVSLGSTSGLAFSTGDGAADPTMTFAGTLARVNVALNGLTITAPSNYIGPSTLVLTSNDQGGTGAGVAGQDTDTVNLSWATVNDPPINTVPAALTILEEGMLTLSSVTDTALSVSDLDVAAGTMQVTLTATGGVLTLGNPGGVSFTVNDGVAEATMTFRATLGEINAALDGTTYTPTPDFAGVATVTMLSNDLGNTGGAGRTDSDVVTVTVAAINDAPVLAGLASAATNEDTARVFSAGQANQIRIIDPDATSMQVSLAASAATISLGTRSGLTFQAGDGTLDATMTFTGSLSQVNSALNGMAFVPAPQFAGVASFELAVSDLGTTGVGGPLTDDGTVQVTVVSINDAPDAVGDTATTSEDAPALEIAVLGNDSSAPDLGETLEITAVGVPLHGTAQITGGGTRIAYTPAANYHGADSVSYTISDHNGGTDAATLSLTVTAVNDPPTAADDSYTVIESSTSNPLTVRGNDSFAPDASETLTVIAVTMPAHGTAVITGPVANTVVNYVPVAGYHGPDAFQYTLADAGGATAVATVSITVGSVDTQPVAVADLVTLAEDAVRVITVLGNDTGLGDAPLTITISTAPGHGTAEVQPDRTVRYVPDADYQGGDALAYTITDADGDVATGAVTLTITAVDDLPIAAGDAITVDEDAMTTVAVLGNDTGLGDRPVTVTVTMAPAHGAAIVDASGVITYRPAANHAGADAFTYRVSDGDGDVATAAVAVTVTAINDAPTAVADVATARPGEPITIDVLDNDRDPDGDDLTVTAVTTPEHGTAAIESDGAITYAPAAGYTGTDRFAYTITDAGGVTATATVDVAVGLDGDGDGLLDLDETEVHGTDPAVADSDDDGLDDGDEVARATDPLDDDSDDDGLLDGSEDATDPNLADSDDDGVLDGTELGLAAPEGDDTVAASFVADADPASTTDPTAADSDGGGLSDGDEDDNADGRRGSGETDPNDPTDDVPAPADGGGCSTSGDSTAPLPLLLLLLLGTGSWVSTRRKR